MDIPLISPRTGSAEPWQWNTQRENAAKLLAIGELTDGEIAQQLGIDRKTLYNWKQNPTFWASVLQQSRELGKVALRYPIGRRERRLRDLDDRKALLHLIRRERAADPDLQDVPGGTTGFVVRNQKTVRDGDVFRLVNEYAVDYAMLKELRELEKQAAIEAGQWNEAAAAASIESNIEINIAGDLNLLSVDELRQLKSLTAKALIHDAGDQGA